MKDMKTLLILPVIAMLFACNKSQTEQPKYNQPIDVYYKVVCSTKCNKRVIIYLYSATQEGGIKRKVGAIDTIVSGSSTFVIPQTDAPYEYAISYMKVICQSPDALYLSIGTKTNEYISSGQSCADYGKEINQEFMKLYH